MSAPPDPNRPQPKLMTKGTFALILVASLVGASLGIIREYRAKGSVSGATLGASIAALALGLVIVSILGWYANKPEK